MSKMRFSKRKLQFSFFCWSNRNRKKKKKKTEKETKNYKKTVFKVVIQKCEKSKKWIFSKNCLTLCVSGRGKNAHFRAHYLFWPKDFLGPKQCKPGNTIKYSGFSGDCPKPKMTPFFFEKGVFDMGEKVGFTNCAVCKQKTEIKQKNSRLF